MIDADGEEWRTVAEAARVLRVRPSALWNWASRGKVRKHRIGKSAWVHMGDARKAEAEWRKRVTPA